MRVLHVIPSISIVHGGPTEALRLMEQGLSDHGINVTTATTDDGNERRIPEIADVGLGGVSCAERVYFRKWFNFYKVAPGIVPWLWRHVRAFDVVHIHALFSFTSIATAVVARLRNVPYIVRPIGTLGRYGVTQRRPWLKRLSLAVLEKRILTGAAAVHFTSEAEWEEAKALNLTLQGIVVPLAARIESGDDAQSFLRDSTLLSDRQTVLFMSRLDPVKNIENLLRALAIVVARKDDVVLLIAGDGQPDYANSLKKLSHTLGLAAHVVWAGDMGGSRKAAALAAAKVFVLPSFSESFGIAGAEAMLAGIPCVFGEGVAIAGDAMQAGASLTVSHDPESIARALAELLSDKAKRERMGRCARQFAEREYSVETMSTRLTALYRRVSNENGRQMP